MTLMRLFSGFFLWALLALPTRAQVVPAPEAPPSPQWQQLRQTLFQNRSISETPGAWVELDAPARPQNAAVVAVTVRALQPQSAQRHVKTLYLVVDQNPSPVAAVFHFGPASGLAGLETRLRIDAYTAVRAIVETNTGELHMSSKFVKASGGCSAPPAPEINQSIALGSMALRVLGAVQPGRVAEAQLAIHHANHSGMVMNQLTRLFTPAHFVRQLKLQYAEQVVLDAELSFALSENPSLRFHFLPHRAGTGPWELSATATDTEGMVFKDSWRVPAP